jgi:uncharacterized protein (TIGR00304 family)
MGSEGNARPEPKTFIEYSRIPAVVDLILAGVGVVLAGFLMVAYSMLASGGGGEGKVRGGGVVMVGPIPIVFGSDAKWASIALVLAIVLIVVGVLVGLV